MSSDISNAKGALTGERYIESLRDGREVWLDGKRVDDVTTHPAFSGMVHEMARIYDLQYTDELRRADDLPLGGDGQPHQLLVQPAAHLRRDDGPQAQLGDLDAGELRATGAHAGLLLLHRLRLVRRAGRAGKYSPKLAGNAARFHRYASEHDLALTHAIGDPQVDRRSTTQGENSTPDNPWIGVGGYGLENPDDDEATALHVVKETRDGIVLRGAKQLATLAPAVERVPGLPLRHLLQPRQQRIRAVVLHTHEHAGPRHRVPGAPLADPGQLRTPLRQALRRAGRHDVLQQRARPVGPRRHALQQRGGDATAGPREHVWGLQQQHPAVRAHPHLRGGGHHAGEGQRDRRDPRGAGHARRAGLVRGDDPARHTRHGRRRAHQPGRHDGPGRRFCRSASSRRTSRSGCWTCCRSSAAWSSRRSPASATLPARRSAPTSRSLPSDGIEVCLEREAAVPTDVTTFACRLLDGMGATRLASRLRDAATRTNSRPDDYRGQEGQPHQRLLSKPMHDVGKRRLHATVNGSAGGPTSTWHHPAWRDVHACLRLRNRYGNRPLPALQRRSLEWRTRRSARRRRSTIVKETSASCCGGAIACGLHAGCPNGTCAVHTIISAALDHQRRCSGGNTSRGCRSSRCREPINLAIDGQLRTRHMHSCGGSTTFHWCGVRYALQAMRRSPRTRVSRLEAAATSGCVCAVAMLGDCG